VGDWKKSTLFDEKEKSVVRWAAALTDNSAPGDDAAFEVLKGIFTEREMVELTLFTCLFNAWNRFQGGFHNPVEAISDQIQWRDWSEDG
jgi:alkylhydroperoxidase family enzyme